MAKNKKVLLVLSCIVCYVGYEYIQFLKIKRIEDYSHIIYKAASVQDKAFSILLGDYITRNKGNYSWNQFGDMEEYFLYLELQSSNPDYKKIRKSCYLESDNTYPYLQLPSVQSLSKTTGQI
jgi:hypothetical protein